MTEEPRVRDIWKQLTHRAVVGHRLVRSVGARGWERPRFARFRRFFERCGVPDPWDPSAPDISVSLGEVGLAQRKTVAPHAAPPSQGAPKGPNLPPRPPPGFPPGSAAPKPPVEGKPAPRIGEVRKDDTAILKKKSMEAEKAKVDPARANAYKVNQPVAKLPMRPEIAAGGVPAKPAVRASMGGPAAPPRVAPLPVRPEVRAAEAPEARAAETRPAPKPAAPGARPTRFAIDPSRRAVLPDGPEELPEEVPSPPPERPTVAAGRAGAEFGMGGGWDDDGPAWVRPPEPAAPSVTRAEVEPPPPAPTPPVAPPRPPPSVPSPASAAPKPAPPAPPKPGAPPPRRGGGGLDDLFGMGGGENTRVRMPKKEEGDAAKPRRPMVTPESELKGGTIDRRPPPPKPPTVVPTGGGGRAADPEGDGGD